MASYKDAIGFGIIGCGAISPFHAEAITHLSDAKLIAVCDTVEERAKSLAEKFDANFCFTDYYKLLETSDINIVNLCLPPSLNEKITLAAAEAGKHVIVEKPMAINLKQADKMITACRNAKVKLGVILPCRFDDDTQRAKRLIEEGKLGKLFLGNAFTNWYRTKEYFETAAWRKTWEGQGGGALMNQAIHAIDLLQWFMGPVKSIYGLIDTAVHSIDVEDLSVAILRFKNNAVGVIEGSTAAYPGFPRKVEVCGEKGTVIIKVQGIELVAIIGADMEIHGAFEQDYINKRDMDASSGPVHLTYEFHRRQLEDFISAVRENREPSVNGEEGRKSLEIIRAIYRSSNIGKEVKLPLIED
jgi:predicted dehydrogenase